MGATIDFGTIRIDTLTNRPAASTVPAGTFFYAWDTKQWFAATVIDGVNTIGWSDLDGTRVADLDLYVNPTTGADTNPGTLAQPLATIGEALARARTIGWSGYCHINLAAGTYTLASNAILAVSGAAGVGAEPLCLVGTMEDSGLGARTVGASTAGSGATFATTTDSVGGLTVNAWQGWFLRYTGGTQAGKQYAISANSATVFSLVGTQSVPTNGDTFVIERPASIVRSGNGVISVTGSGSVVLGARQVRFDGQSIAGSSFVVRSAQFYHSACWFTDFASMAMNFQAAMFTMFAPTPVASRMLFPSLAISQTIGSYYTSGIASANVNTIRNSAVDFQQCYLKGVVVLCVGGYLQMVSTVLQGASGVRCSVSCQAQLSGLRFESVTGVAGDYGSAAVVVDEGSAVTLASSDISNCTNVALSVSGKSVVRVSSLSGSGNAGVPVSVLRASALEKSSGNSVTGAVAGNDVQVGGNAASSAWATVNAGIVTDLAAGAPQLCIASN